MADIARYLTDRGTSCGLARLYESLAARAWAEFNDDREQFAGRIWPYLRGASPVLTRPPLAYTPGQHHFEQIRSISEAAGVPLNESFDYAVELLLGEYDWDAQMFEKGFSKYLAGRRQRGTADRYT